jgi:hypothetical protein
MPLHSRSVAVRAAAASMHAAATRFRLKSVKIPLRGRPAEDV